MSRRSSGGGGGPSAPKRARRESAQQQQDDSIQGLTLFEKRLLELTKQFPKGIPDKIIQNDMPEVSGAERVGAVNNLLALGLLDLYKQGNELLYRSKRIKSEPEEMRNADAEEKVVFDIIGDAGTKGIWIRDIRFKSNLTLTQLNKILKVLENKKLIKAVKSVTASRKKVYMLYDLEPDRSLTGGAWYSDQDFEVEFVAILHQQCLRYLKDKREHAQSLKNTVGSKGIFAMASATLDDIWSFIHKLGISKVELGLEDIESILETLIFDGKIERIYKGDSTLYLAMDTCTMKKGFHELPCGTCPVATQCSENGVINPKTCIYLHQWLE